LLATVVNRRSDNIGYGAPTLLDHTNGQTVAISTIHTPLVATILLQYSVRRMKGKAMGMTTLHSTPLKMILPPTFSVVHEGPSHGYDYNPCHTTVNGPPPTFAMVREGPSHGYDYNPHNTASNVPPPTFVVAHE
jgi:hypothetical protein